MSEKKAITIDRDGSRMNFVVQEHENAIILVRYESDHLPVLRIPEEIEGLPVREIGPSCFFNHWELTEVVFPETLRTIGEGAFALCRRITQLCLPDGITEIGRGAFRDCKGLQKIVLPAGLRTLRTGVFAFCYLSDDVEITLNEGLETIESRVFASGDVNLFFTVKIPSSVKNCAPDAFEPGVRILSSK